LVVKWGNLPIGETEAVEEDGAVKEAVDQTNLSSAQTVSVEGVGDIRFKSVTKQFPSIDWLRRLKHESEDSLLRRVDGEGWNKPDVYFGGNGEILHISVNKGNHKTVPFDSQALKKLQDEQGFSIVGAGYLADLLESGYPPDDFIKATSGYWDRGLGDSTIEIEITPVIIEIVPTGMPIDDLRKPLLHRRIPMILVKEANIAAPLHEPAILTESKFDSVPVEKRVRRSWALKPYTSSTGISGEFDIPRGGVVFDEPLKEAWEQVKSQERGE
jgi:hypothetical protein